MTDPSWFTRARYRAPDWAKRPVLRVLDRNRDLARQSRQQSYVTSAVLVSTAMTRAQAMRTSGQVLDLALPKAPREGLTMEFGVYMGRTLRHIDKLRPNAHGFDSFEGLPEAWKGRWVKGSFAVDRLPAVGTATLHVGWFDDTLPAFLEDHPLDKVAFLHLDADLYSSTVTVLDLLRDRIQCGTVIVFDEYFNYPGWEDHEHRAWMEFVAREQIAFEYVAYNRFGQQVAVEVVERSQVTS